jgi:hypothetical protein
MYSLLPNPFTRPTFWGRKHELSVIYHHLSSEQPQCCALIGESTFGKTSLLRHLADPQVAARVDEQHIEQRFTFVYLDCISYMHSAGLKDSDSASARFWWDLYSALLTKLQGTRTPSLSGPWAESDLPPLERAYELKSSLEDLIREQTERPVIFLLDNFEGIARLPLRDSEWLRSLAQYPCAYVVTSRHLLYLLYHKGSWESPSPLWNLFQDPLYLGLLDEDEVEQFLNQAMQQAKDANSQWEATDSKLVRAIAGRHPALLRLTCARLFQQRLQSNHVLRMNEKEFLELGVYQDTYPICRLLWQGLVDPELWESPGNADRPQQERAALSPYQKALIALAHEQEVTDTKLLFVLEQRGLIERTQGKWHVFADAMRHFVLEQESKVPAHEHPRTSTTLPNELALVRSELPPFTHLEDKVYAYLKAHIGQVCGRDELKQAVWERGENLPGNSALQKIIERIREKIEPDPDNPHYLIAVRGRGYLLREKTAKL